MTGLTITLASVVDWAAETAPTRSTDNVAIDFCVFSTHDGSTTYYGFTAGQTMGLVMSARNKIIQAAAGGRPSAGQEEFTTAGTYSWEAPAGVESVSVVCVGGGGGGAAHGRGSGGPGSE